MRCGLVTGGWTRGERNSAAYHCLQNLVTLLDFFDIRKTESKRVTHLKEVKMSRPVVDGRQIGKSCRQCAARSLRDTMGIPLIVQHQPEGLSKI